MCMFPFADEDSISHKDEPPSPGQVPTSADTLGRFGVVVSQYIKPTIYMVPFIIKVVIIPSSH